MPTGYSRMHAAMFPLQQHALESLQIIRGDLRVCYKYMRFSHRILGERRRLFVHPEHRAPAAVLRVRMLLLVSAGRCVRNRTKKVHMICSRGSERFLLWW